MKNNIENNIGYILFQRYQERVGKHRKNGRGGQIAKLDKLSYKLPVNSYKAHG